jgi:hypothetical protein
MSLIIDAASVAVRLFFLRARRARLARRRAAADARLARLRAKLVVARRREAVLEATADPVERARLARQWLAEGW